MSINFKDLLKQNSSTSDSSSISHAKWLINDDSHNLIQLDKKVQSKLEKAYASFCLDSKNNITFYDVGQFQYEADLSASTQRNLTTDRLRLLLRTNFTSDPTNTKLDEKCNKRSGNPLCLGDLFDLLKTYSGASDSDLSPLSYDQAQLYVTSLVQAMVGNIQSNNTNTNNSNSSASASSSSSSGASSSVSSKKQQLLLPVEPKIDVVDTNVSWKVSLDDNTLAPFFSRLSGNLEHHWQAFLHSPNVVEKWKFSENGSNYCVTFTNVKVTQKNLSTNGAERFLIREDASASNSTFSSYRTPISSSADEDDDDEDDEEYGDSTNNSGNKRKNNSGDKQNMKKQKKQKKPQIKRPY